MSLAAPVFYPFESSQSQHRSGVQGQHRVLVAPDEQGGREVGGAAEDVQPGHVEGGADQGPGLHPPGQRQRDHRQLR